MKVTVKGEPKEIAALVLEIQGRQMVPMRLDDPDDQERSDAKVFSSEAKAIGFDAFSGQALEGIAKSLGLKARDSA